MDDDRTSTYDVVIVGAGSAGCVIARRLVDAGLHVALLEAGPRDDDPRIEDPSRFLELPLGSLDWALSTTPQTALDDRVMPLAVGRVLGGSSTINGMIFARGTRTDFDGWATGGASGWAYDDVLPYFRRLERYDGAETPSRGYSGPLAVRSRYELHPVMAAFREAAVEAGFPLNPDYNDGSSHDGVSQMQHNIDLDARNSVVAAYLRPVAEASNLTVRTDCVVERLLFDGDRCIGVDAGTAGGIERFLAKHEVVLSAGTYGSPKLLLLSGIGPSEDLAALGVEPRVDLAGVGKALQDHVIMPTAFHSASSVPPPRPRDTTYHITIFARSRPDLPQADLQLQPLQMPYVPGVPTSGNGVGILVLLVSPTSRGSMRLASADPTDSPIIDPNLLGTTEDFEALTRGVEIAREIAAQPALSSWCTDEMFPGADHTERHALQQALRRSAGSYWHPVGTCQMGDHDGAVVDSHLRVRGVDGLRVADGSVMPSVVAANTHATVVMIGERAADWVAASAGADASS